MRLVRLLWVVLFILPLGLFANRLCYIDVVDPTYHALLWMHERMGYLFAGIALPSVSLAFARFVRIQGQLRALDTLRSPTPTHIREPFTQVAAAVGTRRFDIVYVDVPMVFCFSVFGGRVVISRGFSEALTGPELRLVAFHELHHIRAADPFKALIWHLVFAALIVPGLEPLEDGLYQRRERRIDLSVSIGDQTLYQSLLSRFRSAMCAATPSAPLRAFEMPGKRALRTFLPTALPVALLVLLVTSHVVFVQNLPYLRAHHC